MPTAAVAGVWVGRGVAVGSTLTRAVTAGLGEAAGESTAIGGVWDGRVTSRRAFRTPSATTAPATASNSSVLAICQPATLSRRTGDPNGRLHQSHSKAVGVFRPPQPGQISGPVGGGGGG